MMLMLLVINETIWSIQVLGSTSAIVDVNSFLAHYGAATKVDLGSFDPVSSLPIGPNTALAAFVVDVIFVHVGAWNMTRQLDPASLVLQADCGCCTYHRPQNGNTTRRRVDVAAAAASAASIYSLSVLVSCFLFFFCSCDIYSSPLRLCQPSCHSTTFTSYSSPVSLSISPFLQPL